MKKFLLFAICSTISAIIFAQETVTVPAQCYTLNTNNFVCNTNVTMRLARDIYGTCLVTEIGPLPKPQEGIMYIFNQGADCNSTFQTIVVNDDCGWIITTKMSQYPESERRHLALFQSTDGNHQLYFFKKKDAFSDPEYLHGYYFKLSSGDEFALRRYIVEKGFQHKLYKELDPIKE